MTTCCGIDLRLGPVAPIKLVLTPEPIRLDLTAAPIKLNVAAAPVKLMVAPQPIKLVVSGVGVQGAPGPQGAAWRNGDGAPSNTLGIDGDFYLDNLTGDVYQRTDGVYAVVANIKGPTGPNAVTTATTTNLTGLLAGDGSNVRLATAGTDYLAPSAVIDTAHGGLGANNSAANGVPVFASGVATVTASPALTSLSLTSALTVNGNTTLGDSSADRVTQNAAITNLPNGLTLVTTHVTGAETLLAARLDEDTASSWSLVNGSGTDGVFAAKFQGAQSAANTALNFTGRGTTDTGVNPLLLFVSQIGSGQVAVRPCVAFWNLATSLVEISASGHLQLKGGAISPTPAGAIADTVSQVAADAAVADRNHYSINESGEIERITGRRCRVTTDFARTSTVTLANVTGLTRNVEAGRKYAFRAVLDTSSNTGGGVKVAISGTCTATHIWYRAVVTEGLAIVAHDRATALGTAVGGVTAVASALIVIEGEIVVNAAGTLTVQFAQNASNGSASTVLTGSNFEIKSLAA